MLLPLSARIAALEGFLVPTHAQPLVMEAATMIMITVFNVLVERQEVRLEATVVTMVSVYVRKSATLEKIAAMMVIFLAKKQKLLATTVASVLPKHAMVPSLLVQVSLPVMVGIPALRERSIARLMARPMFRLLFLPSALPIARLISLAILLRLPLHRAILLRLPFHRVHFLPHSLVLVILVEQHPIAKTQQKISVIPTNVYAHSVLVPARTA